MIEAGLRPPPGPPTVLVVEDDPVVRDFVADALRDEGYRVLAATNGAEALRLLDGGERPALIVLDMNMPVMDGWRFARVYRRTPGPHAPLLVVTAAHDTRRSAEEVGADGYLAKPFDLDQLLDAVAEHARTSA